MVLRRKLQQAWKLYTVAYPGWNTPGVQTEDGVLAPPGKLKNGAPRRRCWMGEGGSMLEVIISFSDNVIGIRLLKIALTLNWLVLNVHASSTRKFEMLSEKWGAHYSVNFMNNVGLLVWVPINRYYWVISGIIVKNVFQKIFKINVKRVYCCILKWCDKWGQLARRRKKYSIFNRLVYHS